MAKVLATEHLGFGVYCIDTGMGRAGLASCYLIVQDGEAALVETGTHLCVPTIVEAITELGISLEQLRYIIPTHVHLDHAGGAGTLMAQCPNAKLLIHPRGERHMVDPEKLKNATIAVYGEEIFAATYGDLIAIEAERVISVNDGDCHYLGDRKLEFLDTPGHARHHFCIYDPLSKGIFTGDTFGVSYPILNQSSKHAFIFPPSTPVHFDPPAWKASIKRLMSLKPQRIYLTHYGMVEQLPQLAADLIEQIDTYAEYATQRKQSEELEKIEEDLTKDSLNRLRQRECQLADEEINALIGLDNKINAQGLAHWAINS
ncbi:MBL fold metallo-hydrolase [Pseudoteredinibacter isoporae]|uniref:Glyoxylase-like metal-dependent hydrolase (Beta-lactamase superfamily II) n=1 Tax=Pseudoteredinibacter isoporae TaxID=570281 RepID=A0A7X0JW81_9GAMM|nr:MBL fold metallo-hydrolase [Pseudoteredinibacter isoporae]MBB6523389.1 glyoxylase-like metal-dependent hydrolase (beta-lactamase superfamily II) [Pseudoteredinibacter isoporae]NHO88900.1 MBL fold metallo-hydrolase [Pseudoteredinibacter isoporae]NIB24392.1 MBL fold metallo-hydrolase [Pseudoteredinibacter isoporae]